MRFENLKNLHDAEIIGIDATASPSLLKVAVRTPEGINLELLFEQCSHYRIIDFIPYNIISRILVFDKNSASETPIRELMKWMTSLCDAESNLTDSTLDTLMLDLMNGDIKLVYFEPSQGAELAIVCQHFQINRNDQG